MADVVRTIAAVLAFATFKRSDPRFEPSSFDGFCHKHMLQGSPISCGNSGENSARRTNGNFKSYQYSGRMEHVEGKARTIIDSLSGTTTRPYIPEISS
jgi:hypothetical protein